ncbi:MAG: GNAT family N-acetyltransferase [Verrucomicrobiaceae bacterium]|nr:MAG: GNAT family N-acetyltransferase [Verrucomicrobiaceae bacterium]
MTTYRQITPDDAPLLADIARIVWGEGHPAGRNLASAYQDGVIKDDHTGWTYSLEGKLTGFSLANRSTGEILMVAMLPEHRRKRIGRELMRQAEGWLWSHGWEEIRFSIHDTSSENAATFLHHFGWRTSGKGEPPSSQSFVKKNPGPSFKLEEHTIHDPATGYTRLLRIRRGPTGKPHRLCLFLDGELYWRDMGVMEILNGLMESGRIPPVAFAFVGCVSGPARQEDLVCNERYLHFIGGHVMDWLKSEIPSLRDGNHLIAGLSLSGLMASFTALHYPGHFSACLSQSGSHWWNHGWFNTMARDLAPIPGRFWLSVGDQENQTKLRHSPSLYQEISQIEGVEKLAITLTAAGATVHTHRHPGTHSYHPWRDELAEAMEWLLKL